MKEILTIGIAGGSGSGKTTLAQNLAEEFGHENLLLLSMDRYYNDLAHLPVPDRAKNNFDHPDAIDWPLFLEQLKTLFSGKKIEAPEYSFAEHLRTGHVSIHPKKVIIIEGILALYNPAVCNLLDLRVFVDTPADIRLIRRMKRDIDQRARTPESVINQWMGTVQPAYLKYVAPSRESAHIILPENPDGGMRGPAQNIIAGWIKNHLGK